MDKSLSALTAFHITGERLAGELDDVGRLDLRPALFGAYRDLSKLRHDFPLVLVNGDAGGGFVRSLSGVVDEILSDIAPHGIAGERLRQHVLKLEQEARSLAAGGEARSLGEIWDDAGRRLTAKTDAAALPQLEESLAQAREGLRFDGETVACDGELPVKFVTHAWTLDKRQRTQRLRDKLDDLTLTLSNILHTDVDNVEEAQGAEKLKRSMGKALEDEFDFDAMSRLLRTAPTGETLPEARRRRLNSVLTVFKSQRFLPPAENSRKRGRRKEPYGFVFDSCEEVLEAIQKRRPEMAKLVKAVAIAELEVANRYDESKHDQFFSHFSHHHLHVEDFALFPPYLVRLHGDSAVAAERTALWQVLSSGLPIKVLVQYDDVLGGDMLGPERLTANIKGPQLAAMALGLGNVFVVQTSSAYLFRLRDSIATGLASDGPALFSLFSGAPPGNAAASNNSPNVAPYLKAAAATESRAFPGYVHDPEAGGDWASRFHLETNSQPDADWPMRDFHYQDAGLQRNATETAFTFIDFVACDRRYANRFARVPQSSWHDGMIPVKEFLDLDAESAASKVPYIWMIDERDALCRAIVEDSLVSAARQCRDMWHSLQELAGINNSHAQALLAGEREIWQKEKEQELEALRGQLEAAAAAPAAPSAAPVAETPGAAAVETPSAAPAEVPDEAVEAGPVEEPYIETPRCTTCNECTELNDRMFAYNDEMQAYILDPDAGSYRQMVEAAEACQVAIIHPGKPRNSTETGLSDLEARAADFN
ncbi:MAG: hypothetical protein QF449_06750 [Alphaproteobacteria bacterium]|jgi:hypothetical protein|nr:hypothetical protein [Alphaproteobacteria bacterium]